MEKRVGDKEREITGVSEAPCPGDEENGAFGEGFV